MLGERGSDGLDGEGFQGRCCQAIEGEKGAVFPEGYSEAFKARVVHTGMHGNVRKTDIYTKDTIHQVGGVPQYFQGISNTNIAAAKGG